ncbi:hypothetical protein [Desertibacillus haloalkaliphilus]|nr:hypothetical protein [Desertibacillus haloalkaliphilus]MBU8907995.1 hypothetical protein [Desertibacillus haloalkaliphilus]
MKEKEDKFRLTYESDGKMGKNKKEHNEQSKKPEDEASMFFNTTQFSE